MTVNEVKVPWYSSFGYYTGEAKKVSGKIIPHGRGKIRLLPGDINALGFGENYIKGNFIDGILNGEATRIAYNEKKQAEIFGKNNGLPIKNLITLIVKKLITIMVSIGIQLMIITKKIL